MRKKLKSGFLLIMIPLMLKMNMLTAWAGYWQEGEQQAWSYIEGEAVVKGWTVINGEWYYFNQDGKMEKGWIRAEGEWYYLDEDTGVWEDIPPMSQDTVCHLLENCMIKAGLYQSEKSEVIYRVEYETEHTYRIWIGREESPDRYIPINTYEVDKRTGVAKSVIRDQTFILTYN